MKVKGYTTRLFVLVSRGADEKIAEHFHFPDDRSNPFIKKMRGKVFFVEFLALPEPLCALSKL